MASEVIGSGRYHAYVDGELAVVDWWAVNEGEIDADGVPLAKIRALAETAARLLMVEEFHVSVGWVDAVRNGWRCPHWDIRASEIIARVHRPGSLVQRDLRPTAAFDCANPVPAELMEAGLCR